MRYGLVNPLLITPATLSDSDFVYSLRNRNEDQYCYFSGSNFTMLEHQKFWQVNYLFYWIATLDTLRLGFYGIVDGDFRFAVCPGHRGLGIGSKLIQHAITTSNLNTVRVAKNNLASIKCFLVNGFNLSAEEKIGPFSRDCLVFKRF